MGVFNLVGGFYPLFKENNLSSSGLAHREYRR